MGCTVEGCAAPIKAKGLCRQHYVAARQAKAPGCVALGCDRPAYCKNLCRGHYARSLRGVPVPGPLREFRRGNGILSVRLAADALEDLRERAQKVGLSANKWAARMLMQLLGL